MATMRLLWSPWKDDLFQFVSGATASVDLAVAYISKATASELVGALPDGVHLRVLTRCSDRDFRSGIADVDMFRCLASHPRSELRAMRNLHAKLYIVDGQTAILGSGNLTRAGLGGDGNHNEEAGLLVDDPSLIREMYGHWNEWWQQATPVDHQFVDDLAKLVAQLPPRDASRIEHAITDLLAPAQMEPGMRLLFDFVFEVNQSFLHCGYTHVMHIRDEYFHRVHTERAELHDLEVLCPDRSIRMGTIRSSASRGIPYYRFRVRCGHPCALRSLREGQKLRVEVWRGSGTARVNLLPDGGG